MTETITEPQAPPEESTPAPTTPDASTAVPGKTVDHTAGGFPVVPLSLSGTNAAAGLLATAALAGGPAALAVAMTGAAVLGTAAAHHRAKNTKKTPDGKPSPASTRTSGGAGGRGLLGRIPSQSRTGKTSGGTANRGAGAGSRKTAGGQARHAAGATGGRSRSTAGKAGSPSARQRAARAAAGLAGGRAGQVQALRSQARTQSPTRSAARTATVQARRQVADTRRAAKAAERAGTAGTTAKPRGAASRTLAKGMGKAAAVRDKAAGAARTAHDRATGRTVGRNREQVQQAAHRARLAAAKAPAQKAARKALRRSAARFHARRALAAVLGGALGVVGLVTTPLGRKLGWGWLMNPGRRLYRFLAGRARAQREARDAEIGAQLEADEEAAEAEVEAEEQDTDEVGDQAARPTTHVPAPPTSRGAHVSNVSGFRFEELAAEMEQAAQSYEPENCMEILAMLEGLPEALQAIANILKILAERSDSEFPLEKVVADMLSDLYSVFVTSVSSSEELGSTFRQAHEADIARFEDPRNGHEAEKGWNV
ncbi:hypothetical protein Snoj_66420 [Streptomyces nojiriensis]|uniref:Uncharacterized protein n=1 Tax=Streptomyces nojiriensis TaxID=66374 RepID=A0ABQ3SX48_9ACTN|nr:hypothetical protein [Streptomyces nojiriensis]QTI46245.1 hypothetical protein JYK04_04056 [Streptomyces nojiriensis]GGR86906.1 hypothetical protein GCM10010205_14140 [Streptomyces nojiriensis]GHI72724.1 hypothetical protein Snoj_66420 [Streptomyces nojiriensis]